MANRCGVNSGVEPKYSRQNANLFALEPSAEKPQGCYLDNTRLNSEEEGLTNTVLQPKGVSKVQANHMRGSS